MLNENEGKYLHCHATPLESVSVPPFPICCLGYGIICDFWTAEEWQLLPKTTAERWQYLSKANGNENTVFYAELFSLESYSLQRHNSNVNSHQACM